MTTTTYVAVQLLKNRFGETQNVIDSHYNELMNLPQASIKTTSLRGIYDKLEKNLRSLHALGQDVDQAIFISIMTSKLPKKVITQREIQKGSKAKWSVKKLGDYTVAKEKAEQHTKSEDKLEYPKETRPKWHTGNDSKPEFRQYKSSTEALLTSQTVNKYTTKTYGNLCPFCEEKHWSDKCPRYRTMEARKQRLEGCCFVCLKSGHAAKDCKAENTCVYCKKHTTIIIGVLSREV